MIKIKIIHFIIGLGILLLPACPSWGEEWIFFDTAFSGDMYYDKSSVKAEGKQIVSVRTKNILNADGKGRYFNILKSLNKAPDDPARLSYSVTGMEINYANKEIRDVSLHFYDEKDQVVYASPQNDSGEWNRVRPDTIGDKLFNLVSWEAGISTKRGDDPEVHKTLLPEKPPVAPSVADKNTSRASSPEARKKDASERAIRRLIAKWLASWESGKMDIYYSCYAPDFQAKGMNLEEWIMHKTSVFLKSKNIRIRMDHLRISVTQGEATAEFTQHYRSSLLRNSVRKKLELKMINKEWKIYRENI